MRVAEVLEEILRVCAGSSEPLVLGDAISTKISCLSIYLKNINCSFDENCMRVLNLVIPWVIRLYVKIINELNYFIPPTSV